MGNENGSGPSSSSGYDCRLIFNEVDKFYTTELNKGQFVGQLFSEISNSNHPLLGNVSICNTFIMERFYTVLIQKTRSTTVNTDSFKALIEKMYKNPDKAIKKSFALIDLDGDEAISDAEFLSYIDNCFISLMAIAEKDITDSQFRVSLREWIMKNKKSFYDQVLGVFNKHKKTDPERWLYADYKRWVLSEENWTLDITLGAHKYRTPLNLLGLLGISVPT